MRKFLSVIIALFMVYGAQAQVLDKTSGQVLKSVSLDGNRFKVSAGMQTKAAKAEVGTLQWCSDYLDGGGLGAGGSTFTIAAQFVATDLASNVGNYITAIKVGVSDVSVVSSAKVMIIENPTGTATTVVSQDVTLANGWNVVYLDEPYLIGSTPIFIACEVIPTGAGYPLSLDAGPANAKGDWVKIGTDAWGHLTTSNINKNNSIMGIVSENATDVSLHAYHEGYIDVTKTGEEVTQGLNVASNNFAGNITVTTEAPYSVSVDGGATYAVSQSIAVSGAYNGALLVKYTGGDVASEDFANVVVSNGATDITIPLEGVTVDCAVNTLPLVQDFEDYSIICWTAVAPSAVNILGRYYDEDARSGDYMWIFSSYNQDTDYNQYLITPLLPETSGDKSVSLYRAAYSQQTEIFRVGYSTTDNAVASFTWGADVSVAASTTVTWGEYTTTVPANAKYVAIHYKSNYGYYLFMDDITIDGEIVSVEIPVAEVTPTALWNAGDVNVGSTVTSDAFTLKNIGTGTLTVTSVTDLSGTAFTTDLGDVSAIELSANESHDFTFTFAPTAAGIASAQFEIVTNGGTQTITLEGEGLEAGGIIGNLVTSTVVYSNQTGIVNVKVNEASVVKVIDTMGRIAGTYYTGTDNTLSFSQPSGVYFIRIEGKGKPVTHKLIVK